MTSVRLLTKGEGEVNRVDRLRALNHSVIPRPFAFALIALAITTLAQTPDLPSLVTEVVDFQKLLPLLPEAPAGWNADKPEGSTTNEGGTRLTNVHRDYRKGEGESAPSTSISILDSAANPEYVEATTAAWNYSNSSSDGYSKSVTLGGNPGFETW